MKYDKESDDCRSMADDSGPMGRPRRGPGRGRPGRGPRGPFFEEFGTQFPFGPDGFQAVRIRSRGGGRVRRGDVRLAILALLLEEPLNGYQIIQAVADRTDGAWRPSPGAVYPALSQLEDEGLVEVFDNDGQRAFRLTEAGRTAAAEVDPKPWDLVNDSADTASGDVPDLWREFGALATAAKAVMVSGSSQQVKAATKALAETRKRLFGILADDGDFDG
ncbi:MAG: helix-turn-helix transcriptional regulator [Brooklawnia sp.]|nr:helix-turn-helix transcriptional regulator [Brooklawnia sp.]